jgi:hypothetical protein
MKPIIKYGTYGLGAALVALSVPALAQDTSTQSGTATPSSGAKTTTTRKTTAKPAGTTSTTPRVAGTAYLRVLHAIPDGPQVDVFVNGQKTVSGANFKTVSEYMPVPSGSKSFKISASGKTDALLEGKKTVSKDKYYTAIAAGTAAKPTFVLQNDSTGKAVEGKAKVRVIHLAPEASTVNVTTASTRSKVGYAKWASNLAFGKSTLKTVTPNTLTLQVRGTDDKVLQEVTGAKFEADKRYAAFVIGSPGGTGARALDLLIVPAAAR